MYANLNEKYIELFSAIYASRSVLPKKQYDQMAEALMSSYKRELSILVGHITLEVSREMFELKRKLKTFVPKRFLWFGNKVAKTVLSSIESEFNSYLQSLAAGENSSPEPEFTESTAALVPVSAELFPGGDVFEK